jgi:hypothetical protein
VRAHKQAGHMDASDLIKALQNTLRGGGRPHMENRRGPDARTKNPRARTRILRTRNFQRIQEGAVTTQEPTP